MEKLNIFKIIDTDFKNMINLNGQEVYINGRKAKALIANNPTAKNFNDKYISSESTLKRGDIVYYSDKYWMLTNGTQRYESFKASMQEIEHEIYFNLSSMATPPYKYILKTPAIIQQTMDFGADYDRNNETITVFSEIHIFVQDNNKTRNLLEITNTSSGSIIFGDRVYKIRGISTVNKGVLDITCNLDGLANSVDRESGVYQTPANLNDVIDNTMFGLDKDFAPIGYLSQVEPLTCEVTNAITDTLGSIFVTWNDEINKDRYVGFEGYKVRLLKDNVEYVVLDLKENELSYTFNVPEGNYIVEVYSEFSTFAEDESSTPAILNNISVEATPEQQLPPSTLTTDVGTITMVQTPTDNDNSNNGTITYTWTKDVNSDVYSGFVGYKLEFGHYLMFGGESTKEIHEVGDISTFTRIGLTTSREYFMRIYTKYVNDGVVFYAKYQESNTMTVQQKPL